MACFHCDTFRPDREKVTLTARTPQALIGLLSGEPPHSTDFYPRLLERDDLQAAAAVRKEIATRAANETSGWIAFDALMDGSLWLPDQTANDLDAMLSPRSVEHMARLPLHWDERESLPLILCKHMTRPAYPLDPPTGFVWFVDARTDGMLLRSLEAIGWLEVTKTLDAPPSDDPADPMRRP